MIPIGIIIIILAFLAIAWSSEWSFVGGPNDPGRYDFQAGQRRATKNDALACTEGLCAKPDWILPAYSMPPDRLIAEIVERMKRIDPRSRRVDTADTPGYARLLTFSPIMRFPDAIDVEAIGLPGQKTGLRVYSRAKLGSSDFGKNAEHIRRLTRGITP